MRTLLVFGIAACAQAHVAFYPIPFYRGEPTAADTAVSDTGSAWVPAQSLTLTEGTEIVTFPLPNFEGNASVWRHNTTYINATATPIGSYQLRPATPAAGLSTAEDTPAQPWKIAVVPSGAINGYALVRNSTLSPGNPECYSTTGTACYVRSNVNALAAALTAISSTDTTVQCGPDSGSVGNGTLWTEDPFSQCAAAREALRVPATTSSWQCISGNSGIVGVFFGKVSNSMQCVHGFPEPQNCTAFASQATCSLALGRLVGAVFGVATKDCGDYNACMSISRQVPIVTVRRSEALSWQAGAVFGATGVLAILGLSYIFGPRRQTPAVNIEATCTSSCADDDVPETRYVAAV
ncbi:hypothetical protein ACHHYP_06171 [Achlya hypogyna]|uniref:Secreted protein n=1 Tax=Achlya hypogyna TaxID=1202772 RepID=A0A1V9ZN69_ACHHY|nr:hypothetical protein ACHHYP_06171 [Achlya hypogyna]